MKLIPCIEVMLTPRHFRLPRVWSNRMLSKVADVFEGSVVNVSAWEDSDKEGDKYRNYFKQAQSYSITNYGGESGTCKEKCYHLDLEKKLPDELKERFDVVFNHTSLEHIFDVFKGVENLCLMSRDIVIVVVPFIQVIHYNESFSDYWRFTPRCLERLFDRHKLKIVLMASSPYKGAIYNFCIASKNPERWNGKFDNIPQQMMNDHKSIYKESFIIFWIWKIWNRLRLMMKEKT